MFLVRTIKLSIFHIECDHNKRNDEPFYGARQYDIKFILKNKHARIAKKIMKRKRY